MQSLSKLSLFSLILFIIVSCSNNKETEKTVNAALEESSTTKNTIELSTTFNDYWYDGKAELSRYQLSQNRYGELHEGEAVLIFVTEDFLTEKQVKYEGGTHKEEIASVLKLNRSTKFFTGIYPYSIMTSIFSPVDAKKPTLKVSSSSQEWCGHTFSQLNYRKNQYQAQLFSYFMKESDQNTMVPAALLEDEVWTKIRLAPSTLPIGEIDILPGAEFLRLKHKNIAVQKAQASLETFEDTTLSSNALQRYTIAYEDIPRKLAITFEQDFPHAILSWTEEAPKGFGQEGTLTTTAVLTHSLKEPYWSLNSVKDSIYTRKLGLQKSNY